METIEHYQILFTIKCYIKVYNYSQNLKILILYNHIISKEYADMRLTYFLIERNNLFNSHINLIIMII